MTTFHCAGCGVELPNWSAWNEHKCSNGPRGQINPLDPWNVTIAGPGFDLTITAPTKAKLVKRF